jgi:predicted nucleic-acid-binding protein
MKILDANVILRYVLEDDEVFTKKAKKLVNQGSVLAPREVIAEVVFVLRGKNYNVKRCVISETLINFLAEINSQDKVLRRGLETYAESNLDFVDCLLCAYHSVNGNEICTFDNGLIKMLNKFRKEEKHEIQTRL